MMKKLRTMLLAIVLACCCAGVFVACAITPETPTDTKKDLSEATLTLSETTFVYDGTAHEPTVTVTLDETTVAATNYTVSYSNNTEVGTATVTVTAKANTDYKGSKSANFTIAPAPVQKKDLADATITLSQTSYVADGTEKEPTVTVTLDGETVAASNYDVTYANNVEPGTATVTVTAKAGSENYTGSKSVQFDITDPAKINLSEAVLTLAETTFTYSGEAHTPSFTLKYNGTDIDDGDYTYQYTSNVNAGTATLTVTATAESAYTGSKSATFTIQKANLSGATVEVATATYTYTGSAFEPTVTVTFNGNTVDAENYDVSYSDNTNAGQATVTVTAKDGSTNFTGNKAANFTIDKANLSGATVEVATATYTYTGSAFEPTVTVTFNGATVAAENYDVSYSGNTNAGQATVTVTAKSGSTNFAGTQTANFTIEKANLSGATVEVAAATYTGDALEPTVTVTFNGNTVAAENYDVAYSGNTNAGTASVTVTAKADSTNFLGTKSGDFTIGKADLAGATITVAGATYTGEKLEPAVTVTFNEKTVDASNYDIAYSDNTNAGEGSVTITPKGNFTGEPQTKRFTIDAADWDGATLTLGEDTFVYNGNAHEPTLTVTFNEKTLTDSDYDVNWNNNMKAGQASVTVSPKGNYKGTALTATFTIDKAQAEHTVNPEELELTAALGAKYSELDLPDGVMIQEDEDELIFTNAGKAQITVVLAEMVGGEPDTENFETTTGTLEVTVEKAAYTLINGDQSHDFLYDSTAFVDNKDGSYTIDGSVIFEGLFEIFKSWEFTISFDVDGFKRFQLDTLFTNADDTGLLVTAKKDIELNYPAEWTRCWLGGTVSEKNADATNSPAYTYEGTDEVKKAGRPEKNTDGSYAWLPDAALEWETITFRITSEYMASTNGAGAIRARFIKVYLSEDGTNETIMFNRQASDANTFQDMLKLTFETEKAVKFSKISLKETAVGNVLLEQKFPTYFNGTTVKDEYKKGGLLMIGDGHIEWWGALHGTDTWGNATYNAQNAFATAGYNGKVINLGVTQTINENWVNYLEYYKTYLTQLDPDIVYIAGGVHQTPREDGRNIAYTLLVMADMVRELYPEAEIVVSSMNLVGSGHAYGTKPTNASGTLINNDLRYRAIAANDYIEAGVTERNEAGDTKMHYFYCSNVLLTNPDAPFETTKNDVQTKYLKASSVNNLFYSREGYTVLTSKVYAFLLSEGIIES